MLQYLTGDATYPAFKGNKIICHICNTSGAWGKGFVLAISKRWKSPRNEYFKWKKDCSNLPRMPLGEIQLVQVEINIWVANMIAQHGLYWSPGDPPRVRYGSLRKCLQELCEKAILKKASVHMPRIGTGLAGGDWTIIEEIITEELVENGINVYVYDWES